MDGFYIELVIIRTAQSPIDRGHVRYCHGYDALTFPSGGRHASLRPLKSLMASFYILTFLLPSILLCSSSFKLVGTAAWLLPLKKGRESELWAIKAPLAAGCHGCLKPAKDRMAETLNCWSQTVCDCENDSRCLGRRYRFCYSDLISDSMKRTTRWFWDACSCISQWSVWVGECAVEMVPRSVWC